MIFMFYVRCPVLINVNLIDDCPKLNDGYDFDIELDFDLMGIEQEETTNDEIPPKIKEWVKDKLKPNLEQTITINIGTNDKLKELQIGVDLSPEQKDEMTRLLAQYKDVFARSHDDMIRLSIDIIVHRLQIKKGFKPAKKKLRMLKFK